MPRQTITVVTANVQGLCRDQNRSDLFTHFSRRTKADLFLLTEIGTPSPEQARQWAEEARFYGLDAFFHADTQAAIVWRPSSLFTDTPRNIRSVSANLSYKNRSIDAIFQIHGKEYFVMSVYVPVLDAEKILSLIHI